MEIWEHWGARRDPANGFLFNWWHWGQKAYWSVPWCSLAPSYSLHNSWMWVLFSQWLAVLLKLTLGLASSICWPTLSLWITEGTLPRSSFPSHYSTFTAVGFWTFSAYVTQKAIHSYEWRAVRIPSSMLLLQAGWSLKRKLWIAFCGASHICEVPRYQTQV